MIKFLSIGTYIRIISGHGDKAASKAPNTDEKSGSKTSKIQHSLNMKKSSIAGSNIILNVETSVFNFTNYFYIHL